MNGGPCPAAICSSPREVGCAGIKNLRIYGIQGERDYRLQRFVVFGRYPRPGLAAIAASINAVGSAGDDDIGVLLPNGHRPDRLACHARETGPGTTAVGRSIDA